MNLNTNLNALLSAPTGPLPMAPNHGIQDRGFGPTNQMQQQQQHHQHQQSNIAGNQMGGHQMGGQQPMNVQHDEHNHQMPNMGHPGPGQQQQQQQQPGPSQLTTAQLCRLGQETVQEIVTKTQELFALLKTMQPPNGTQPSINAQEDKKNKLQEALKIIGLLFKRLRKVYEKCLEGTTEMEYVQMESLIPLRDEPAKNANQEDKKSTEQFRRFEEERKQYTEQLKLRNRQLKEIIDKLREVVWEINTMLAIRKP